MFDLARVAALLWLLFAAFRGRAVGVTLAALAFAYLMVLEVVSGITIRDQGPMLPAVALLLIFIGPSGMPRGPLPSLPLAHTIIEWPALMDGLTGVVFAVLAWRANARIPGLPVREEERIRRVSRLTLALLLNAVFQGLLCIIRVLPVLFCGELGSGNIGRVDRDGCGLTRPVTEWAPSPPGREGFLGSAPGPSLWRNAVTGPPMNAQKKHPSTPYRI